MPSSSEILLKNNINNHNNSWSSGVYDTNWGWDNIDPFRFAFGFNVGGYLHYGSTAQINAAVNSGNTIMYSSNGMTNINYSISGGLKMLGDNLNCYMAAYVVNSCSSTKLSFKIPLGATILNSIRDSEAIFQPAWIGDNMYNQNFDIYSR